MHDRYWVYILLCADRTYYTGVTNNVDERLIEHQEGICPKCYTYMKRPVKLVYKCGFREVFDAIEAEKQSKGWSRKKKEALMRGDFELISILCENRRQRETRAIRNVHHAKTRVTLRPLEGGQ